MLSPHELATLMLVKNAPDWIEPDRMELGALRELQLIDIEPPESGVPLPRLTPRGDALLRACANCAPGAYQVRATQQTTSNRRTEIQATR